jgi:uncharacterized protein YuzE
MVVGNDENFSWDYSEKSDILNVHEVGKKTAGSAELADFTIDFDNNGNVVGLEVMHASEFFSDVDITNLSEIKTAKLLIKPRGNALTVAVKLSLPHMEQVVPIPAPVVAA